MDRPGPAVRGRGAERRAVGAGSVRRDGAARRGPSGTRPGRRRRKRMSERTGEWRRERLRRSRLYVVTDAREGRGDLAGFLEEILSAGVDIVQLREKDAEA